MIGGSSPGGGWEIFSKTPYPDRFWGPSASYPVDIRGPFPESKASSVGMEMLQKSNRIRKGKYSFSINVLY